MEEKPQCWSDGRLSRDSDEMQIKQVKYRTIVNDKDGESGESGKQKKAQSEIDLHLWKESVAMKGGEGDLLAPLAIINEYAEISRWISTNLRTQSLKRSVTAGRTRPQHIAQEAA